MPPFARPGRIGDPVWVDVAVPTQASLRGLAVVDAQVVWLGGQNGTLLRTTDGGATWTDVAPPGSGAWDFRDVEAFDAHAALAMVAGQPAKVLRTLDGGRSWTVVLEDPRPAAFFDAMAFAGSEGVLVGDPVDGTFCVWRSHDAGRTWLPVPSGRLPAPVAGEAAFAASGRCSLFVGRGRAAIVTGGAATRFVADRGSMWTAVPLPLRSGRPAEGAFAAAFEGERGVVVGGDYEHPDEADDAAAWTDDGGQSWYRARTGGYRSAVAWFGVGALVAVGPAGADLSVDAGRSWCALGERGFHAVAVGRDGAVFACGAGGRVARLSLER
ncbi:MAG: oxidoreductase [Planctomycetes bacterium]|nr:oxidoreductase [Planctomycetota bacterium]